LELVHSGFVARAQPAALVDARQPLVPEDGCALAFVDGWVAIHRRRKRSGTIGAEHSLILEFAVMVETRELIAMRDLR